MIMRLDTNSLKDSLKKQMFEDNDITARCFNRGIDTAIKVIEIFEDTELIKKGGNNDS